MLFTSVIKQRKQRGKKEFMKQFVLSIFIICLAFVVKAQDQPADYMYIIEKDGAVFFEEVQHVEGAGAQELYSRAREWFAVTFRSSKAVLQLEDGQNFKLIGRGGTSYTGTAWGHQDGTLYFKISFFARDGRYKLNFSNMEFMQGMETPWPAEHYLLEKNYYNRKLEARPLSKAYDNTAHIEINRIADDLQQALSSKTALSNTVTGDNW